MKIIKAGDHLLINAENLLAISITEQGNRKKLSLFNQTATQPAFEFDLQASTDAAALLNAIRRFLELDDYNTFKLDAAGIEPLTP